MEPTTESQHKEKRDVYTIITNRIIEQLEHNLVPWQKPWTSAGLPKNLISMKPYRGINVWLLASAGYEQNYFLTFEQAKNIGAKIKKGEKGHIIAFWKRDEVEDKETGEMKLKSFLQYHYVFNIEQCRDIPKEKIPVADKEKPNNPIKVCEGIVYNMPQKPAIMHKEQQAYYHPQKDFINMPRLKTFVDSESYYGTLFHELVHSTGHTSRLARKEVMEMQPFGTKTYSLEELTAEIGACHLMSYAGIARNPKDDIIYPPKEEFVFLGNPQEWTTKLKSDKRFIVQASAHAQRATDFILGIKYEEKRTDTVQETTNDAEKEDVF